MKGIILTTTGETLATPTPGELAKLFVASPKVGLNFSKIFDFDDDHETENAPASPSVRERTRPVDTDDSNHPETPVPIPPTRLRRPSMVRVRPSAGKASPTPATSPSESGPAASLELSAPTRQPQSSAATRGNSAPFPSSRSGPDYDLNDEENLPSPFLKKVERGEIAPVSSAGTQASRPPKRISHGNLLRAVAAANAVYANSGGKKTVASEAPTSNQGTRPLLVSARKATEEARKVLLRP